MDDSKRGARRRSCRTPKRKKGSQEAEEWWPMLKKTHRKCEKVGCPAEKPTCFANVASGCCKDGYTSRWYHMSNTEHFCNECFEYFYRSHKDGNVKFTDWKLASAANCQKELSLKFFFAEEVLPYWANCIKCRKWRQASNKSFQNGVIDSQWECSEMNGASCSNPEDEFISEARSISWLKTMTYLPLLKFNSPFTALKEYYCDGVGFSPASISLEMPNGYTDTPKDFIQPFYHPSDAPRAGCYNPDIMLQDEREAFPDLVAQPWVYLGLRNLVISLWNTNFKEFYSLEKCLQHVVVRGTVRITLCEILKQVLDFLTLKGKINFGVISNIPAGQLLNGGGHFKGSVVVIGAGVAGVTAAKQLERAGCKVKVLEARDDIGGRVKDDNTLGVCVSKGPQIITGYINNPLSIVCEQIDNRLRILRPKCNLLSSEGKIADEDVDQKVELYFNLMLESLEELKNEGSDTTQYDSLKDSIDMRKKDLEAQIYRELTEEENCLIEFHLANLEFACGASLENISAMHWNQNESTLQYSGEHAWVDKGFKYLLQKLSEGLDIRLCSEVTSIDYSNEEVKVCCNNGEEYTADKVIVTVPLSMLQKEKIKFKPVLPVAKKKAISNLGAGLIEKVAMKFKNNFWKKKIEKADYFGRVPDSCDGRGFSCLFYDVSDESNFVLMSLIAGKAVEEMSNKSDKQVITECIQVLSKMFPEEKISSPEKYFVSRWSKEENIEMTYSYVGLNGCGDDYDKLAEDIDGKLFFAGEATNRGYPQTVTGAFISGIREAEKILTR
eukprot:gene12038-13280_t